MDANPSQSPYSPLKALAILVLAPAFSYLFFSSHEPVLSVFFTALLLWFTEAVPLPVTALLVPILIALLGLLPASEVFSPFGSDILYLFLGCFLMGISMAKYGFDRRVAYWLLGRCIKGDSLLAINVVIASASFLLSMWISNTAAAAIMSAITIGVLDSLRGKISDKEMLHKVTVRLLLSCAFASSIGGLATPVGSPPNLIALKYLAGRGVEISFIGWMMFGLPISLIMLMMLFVIFERFYPICGVRVEKVRDFFSAALASLGKMGRGEKQIAVVFCCTVVLWVLPGVLKNCFPDVHWIEVLNQRLSMSVVGLSGGVVMFFLPLLDKNNNRVANLAWDETHSVEWGTILLFGGGLSLGNLLEQSGTAKAFGELLFQGEVFNLPVLVGTIIVVSILLSEFASNTAAAAIIVPLIIGVANTANVSSSMLQSLVLCVAFSASFGFMLPVSTPPNAIVYGTGRIRSRDMMKTGAWFDITGAIIIGGFFGLRMLLAVQ